jgi:hypothetical protein
LFLIKAIRDVARRTNHRPKWPVETDALNFFRPAQARLAAIDAVRQQQRDEVPVPHSTSKLSELAFPRAQQWQVRVRVRQEVAARAHIEEKQ